MDGWTEHVPRQPGAASTRMPIMTPKPGLPVFAFLIGGPVWERQLHYSREAKGRTWPCEGKACAFCPHVGKRPTGWVCAVTRRGLRRVILQLSDHALRMYDAIEAAERVMRGVAVVSERADSRKNSKQLLVAEGRYDLPASLPQPWDIRPTLHLTWGSAFALQTFSRDGAGSAIEPPERVQGEEPC